MNCVYRSLAVTTVILVTLPVVAQAHPLSADQVLERYVWAIGGMEKLRAVHTWVEKRVIAGDMPEMARLGSPTPLKRHGTEESAFKIPNVWIRSVRIDNVGTYMSGCDAGSPWIYASTTGVQARGTGEESKRECGNSDGIVPFVFHRIMDKIQLKGQKTVNGRLTWLVESRTKEAHNIYYFDADTYLLIRVDSFVITDMREPSSRWISEFSDYRTVEGLRIPFVVTQHTDNTERTRQIQNLVLNGPVDDAIFQKPKN